MKMKKIYWLFCVLLAIGLGACTAEVDEILFDDKNASISFLETAYEIDEDVEEYQSFDVIYHTSCPKDVVVDFDFDTEGIANPAIEGVDFELLNPTKSLTFGETTYKNAIRIKLIGNDSVDANRHVRIKLKTNSLDLPLGLADSVKSEILITIINNDIEVDESHPLIELFGNYTESDYDFDGNYDSESGNTVTILPDPDDQTQVLIMNFWGINESFPDLEPVAIKATVDLENMTMNIIPGQVMFYHSPDHGFCKAYRYDLAAKGVDMSGDIVCQIDQDGNITSEAWVALLDSRNGWGMLKTVFSKN